METLKNFINNGQLTGIDIVMVYFALAVRAACVSNIIDPMLMGDDVEKDAFTVTSDDVYSNTKDSIFYSYGQPIPENYENSMNKKVIGGNNTVENHKQMTEKSSIKNLWKLTIENYQYNAETASKMSISNRYICDKPAQEIEFTHLIDREKALDMPSEQKGNIGKL